MRQRRVAYTRYRNGAEFRYASEMIHLRKCLVSDNQHVNVAKLASNVFSLSSSKKRHFLTVMGFLNTKHICRRIKFHSLFSSCQFLYRVVASVARLCHFTITIMVVLHLHRSILHMHHALQCCNALDYYSSSILAPLKLSQMQVQQ